MHSRRALVACLMLVVVARGLHCLYTDAIICARAVESAGGAQPLADPADTDPNESSCLCKGAIFTPPCLPVDVQTHPPSLVAAEPVVALPADLSLGLTAK